MSCLQVELNNSVLNGFENINQGDITCADGGSDADVCPFVDFSSNAQALMTDMIGCLKSLSNQSGWLNFWICACVFANFASQLILISL